MSRSRNHGCRPASATRTRGSVLIVLLLSMVLLAALLAYVMNLGRQTGARITTQHAADAAAVSGAGWVARSMNSIAMNNCAMARLIVTAGTLDALPQSVEYTLVDQKALVDALNGQSQAGLPPEWNAGPPGSQLVDHFIKFRGDAIAERDALVPIDNLLNHSGFDMRETTFFAGPNGRGHVWRAAMALNDLNTATVDTLADLQYLQASSMGGADLPPAGGASRALLVPREVKLPIQRGSFDDFRRPVREGLLPADADDPVIRRGPFDAVHGWRHMLGGSTNGFWKPKTPGPSWTGSGHTPLGGGGPSGSGSGGGVFVITSRTPPTSYKTYGVQEWLLTHSVANIWGYQFVHRLPVRIRQLANNKLNNLWPGGPDPGPIYQPQWVVGLADAAAIADADPSRVRETMFVGFRIKSRYPASHPDFLSDGSWAWVNRTADARDRPLIVVNGWMDPRKWPVPKIANDIWRDQYEYEAGFDTEIGLTPQFDANGNYILQKVYRIDDFMFGGVNVGQPATVRNPYNIDSTDLPAPTDLDHAKLAPDADGRSRLKYLGVASRPDTPLLWPSRFSPKQPYPHMVAVAQAKVFNDHSWDLWTQMWHAQLEPVGPLDEWIALLAPGAPTAPPTDTSGLHAYLTSIAPMADPMLHH